MRFGELRHSLTIQQPGSAVKDAYGAPSEPYTTVVTAYGSIRQLTGRESFVSGQMAAEVSHLLEIRYDTALSGIDPSWQVLLGARVFDIVRSENVLEANKILELQVRERVE